LFRRCSGALADMTLGSSSRPRSAPSVAPQRIRAWQTRWWPTNMGRRVLWRNSNSKKRSALSRGGAAALQAKAPRAGAARGKCCTPWGDRARSERRRDPCIPPSSAIWRISTVHRLEPEGRLRVEDSLPTNYCRVRGLRRRPLRVAEVERSDVGWKIIRLALRTRRWRSVSDRRIYRDVVE
jgi:hypothetical protein